MSHISIFLLQTMFVSEVWQNVDDTGLSFNESDEKYLDITAEKWLRFQCGSISINRKFGGASPYKTKFQNSLQYVSTLWPFIQLNLAYINAYFPYKKTH